MNQPCHINVCDGYSEYYNNINTIDKNRLKIDFVLLVTAFDFNYYEN